MPRTSASPSGARDASDSRALWRNCASGLTVVGEAEWWSIEVLEGELSAHRWRGSYGSALIESAITSSSAPAVRTTAAGHSMLAGAPRLLGSVRKAVQA